MQFVPAGVIQKSTLHVDEKVQAEDKKTLRTLLEDLYRTYRSICEFRKIRARSTNMLIKFFYRFSRQKAKGRTLRCLA